MNKGILVPAFQEHYFSAPDTSFSKKEQQQNPISYLYPSPTQI